MGRKLRTKFMRRKRLGKGKREEHNRASEEKPGRSVRETLDSKTSNSNSLDIC